MRYFFNDFYELKGFAHLLLFLVLLSFPHRVLAQSNYYSNSYSHSPTPMQSSFNNNNSYFQGYNSQQYSYYPERQTRGQGDYSYDNRNYQQQMPFSSYNQFYSRGPSYYGNQQQSSQQSSYPNSSGPANNINSSLQGYQNWGQNPSNYNQGQNQNVYQYDAAQMGSMNSNNYSRSSIGKNSQVSQSGSSHNYGKVRSNFGKSSQGLSQDRSNNFRTFGLTREGQNHSTYHQNTLANQRVIDGGGGSIIP